MARRSGKIGRTIQLRPMLVARVSSALALGLVATSVLACTPAKRPPYLIDLAGEHRFLLGDDPAFAEPGFDESAWSTVAVPGTWRAWGFDRGDMVGWYRIRFEVPPHAPPHGLALDLGVVGWADEAYVNGRLVGATGSLDRLPEPILIPRLYRLPAGALRPGENLLAIRVRGVPITSNGLLAERIGIGDERELSGARGLIVSRTVAAETMLMGFLAFGWLLVAFFPKRGRTGRATIFLWISVTMQLVHLWLLSVIAHDTGRAIEGGPQMALATIHLAGCGMWGFVATITRGRLPRVIVVLVVAGTVMALLSLLWVDAIAALGLTSGGISLLANGVVLWLLVTAVRAQTPGALPILVGYVVLLVTVFAVVLLPSPFLLGLRIPYYGLAFLAASAMLALTRHVRETNRQAQRASEYALEAHTRERTRLARDLHDGLGQMLALLKLHLQRTGAKHDGQSAHASFDEGVTQVDATIEELRRIARDLRPKPMEGRGFGEAVREYAAAMARRSDLDLRVQGDYGPLREGVGDELYRIVQECLTNCLKHSGARRVIVSLADVADRHTLTIADDGRGLPAQATSTGIGLATIRERSELLGGACTIDVAPGGGTRVAVSVPR